MGVKYVKDFSFPSSGGFHGDVQRYAKGGHVTKMPAKAKASAKDMPARAKPNAPAKGAPKMASKPAKGKRQGYNEGGRVPGYEMDRLPTKRPPGRGMDLAPARRFKGDYQGYEDGGEVYVYDKAPDNIAYENNAYQLKRDLDEVGIAEDPTYEDRMNTMRLVGATTERDRLVREGVIPSVDRADARRAAMSERAGMREDMMRPRGLGRAVMRARDKIASRMKVPTPVSRMRAEVLPAPMAPVRADRSIMEEPYYGGMVNPAVLPAFKKGGEVKGKKIAKVMREYKEGKLHSGSKKGPKVKNPKQAMAIALSEARKAGAKIPKKAEGGIFNDESMAYESKGPKTRGTARKGRIEGRRERRAREAMERAEKYAPGLSLDMADRKNRGGMPVHRRKPMYGGGKC